MSTAPLPGATDDHNNNRLFSTYCKPVRIGNDCEPTCHGLLNTGIAWAIFLNALADGRILISP